MQQYISKKSVSFSKKQILDASISNADIHSPIFYQNQNKTCTNPYFIVDRGNNTGNEKNGTTLPVFFIFPISQSVNKYVYILWLALLQQQVSWERSKLDAHPVAKPTARPKQTHIYLSLLPL